MATTAGPTPATWTLNLYDGASCKFYIDKTVNGTPSSYTGSEVVTAVICGTEFTATKAGARATFALTKAQVTTLVATRKTDAAVWYDDGTDKGPVYEGKVSRHLAPPAP